ncbi:hypothetical protein CAPTEDRAFT_192100 [Capitella teleta]|uniref:HIT-type domain-containing protein n=1 Tax=Capitella teleta TaxID=283909 RepID=R7TRQ1_CAPTE|nr:hypothetical protein CAPTEDRAFT_192100 [Capitella teleta]|eukprot:ELT96294.1 hypothetical protein CAPTEDRAFT_192100 [Capitella teleta]
MASATSCSSETERVCKICHKNDGKYTCPRCNLAYCSVDCYKGVAHADCSETFYKDCVMQGLAEMNAGSEEKEKILETLQRLEDHNPVVDPEEFLEDGDEEEDLAERIADLDLDDDADLIWQRLTPKEQKEFQEMMKDGRLGNMIETWTPWWMHKSKVRFIEEVGAASEDEDIHPPIMKGIPPLSCLIKNGSPAPNLQYDIMNLLYAFVYIARLRNGEYSGLQSAQELIELSGALRLLSFQSLSEAVQSAMDSSTKNAELRVSEEFSLSALNDLQRVCSGPNQQRPFVYILTALSEIQRLFVQAKKQLSKEMKASKTIVDGKSQKTVMFRCQKKVEFFLSWVSQLATDELNSLATDLDILICEKTAEISQHKTIQKKFEKSWQGSKPPKKGPMIEELQS